jgi:hypothetical protein
MSDEEAVNGDEAKLGETVSFPFDRMTVEQFRVRFPRARWSDARSPTKRAGTPFTSLPTKALTRTGEGWL